MCVKSINLDDVVAEAASAQAEERGDALVRILVRKRPDDWLACLAGASAYWGRGRNADEAIGDLVRTWPERFAVTVTVTVPNTEGG